jgi:hypothetical protein
MSASILGLCVLMVTLQAAGVQDKPTTSSASSSNVDQEIVELSKQKWLWMAERNVERLDALFHENSMFVHMGGAMTKSQELGVIKGGQIHYKSAEIQDVSVRRVGTTAIVYSKIRLVAVVGGNEVTNPFMVTEVYVQEGGAWKLGSLAFTRLLGQ